MIEHKRLLELVSYTPTIGVFTRRTSHKRWHAGQRCGFENGNGYHRLAVDGRVFYAHRLAWFYVTGGWPDGLIDHKNGDRTDNRFANLRISTNSQNSANAKPRQRLKGITPRSNGRWVAQITFNYENKYLGIFDTPEEAHAAYVNAAEKFFGPFARPA